MGLNLVLRLTVVPGLVVVPGKVVVLIPIRYEESRFIKVFC